MRRRAFVTLLGAMSLAWSLAVRAQQGVRVRRIGVLIVTSRNNELWQTYLAEFRQRLHDLGWTDGVDIRIDYRFTDESAEQIRIGASELVATAPEVILVNTNPAVSALKQATHTIPIVFTSVSDAVGSGFVTSLAHPGGNITGFHNFEPAMGGKWLQVLQQIAPFVHRAAVVHDSALSANVAFLREAERVSGSLGMTVMGASARDATDIERALTTFAGEPNGGLIIAPNPVNTANRELIVSLATRLRLPAVYPFRYYAASGGLVSYGIDQRELVRGTASYVDRILRGANPGELPVQLPTKYELVINLGTAKAMGLTIAQSLLTRADEVIQ